MHCDFDTPDFTMPGFGSDGIDCVTRQEFDCGKDEQVFRHQHVVRHQHDIINKYDVIHEHDYNYYDVVCERDVVRHNDYTTHEPNYCDTRQDCDCARPVIPPRGFGFRRRMW